MTIKAPSPHPRPTPEATPEATPAETPVETPVAVPVANLETTPAANLETTSEVTQEATLEVTLEPTLGIATFLRAAARRFAGHDSAIARQICRGLEVALSGGVLSGGALMAPAATPACGVLPGMLAPPRDELTDALAACLGDLHWRPAGFGRVPPPADRLLAVCEVLGPAGMFARPDLRFGLLLQREGFVYPRHWHAAEELYLVISGTARWAVDETAPTPRAPGSFVHHASMQPHTMITGAEPILALWGWTGDIEASSYSV